SPGRRGAGERGPESEALGSPNHPIWLLRPSVVPTLQVAPAASGTETHLTTVNDNLVDRVANRHRLSATLISIVLGRVHRDPDVLACAQRSGPEITPIADLPQKGAR